MDFQIFLKKIIQRDIDYLGSDNRKGIHPFFQWSGRPSSRHHHQDEDKNEDHYSGSRDDVEIAGDALDLCFGGTISQGIHERIQPTFNNEMK